MGLLSGLLPDLIPELELPRTPLDLPDNQPATRPVALSAVRSGARPVVRRAA